MGTAQPFELRPYHGIEGQAHQVLRHLWGGSLELEVWDVRGATGSQGLFCVLSRGLGFRVQRFRVINFEIQRRLLP